MPEKKTPITKTADTSISAHRPLAFEPLEILALMAAAGFMHSVATNAQNAITGLRGDEYALAAPALPVGAVALAIIAYQIHHHKTVLLPLSLIALGLIIASAYLWQFALNAHI